MPLLVAALWTAFLALIPTLVGRVMLSLGLGYFTYSGLDLALSTAKSALFANISGFGGVVYSLAGILQIGTAVNILVSAYLARLVVNGVVNGALTKIAAKT